ncbi:FxLYD domain-containing protein [Chloroflexota bacterium]
MTGIFAIALALVLALSLIGCAGKEVEPEEEEVTQPGPAKLEILSHKRTTGAEFGEKASPYGWEIIIVGTAKNISGDTLESAQVQAKFLDEEGKEVLPKTYPFPVGYHPVETSNLAPGEIWEFTIKPSYILLDNEVHRYEIEVGICY